jgi:hypothetical protein
MVLENEEGVAGLKEAHISRFIKSRIITLAGYVVHMGDR